MEKKTDVDIFEKFINKAPNFLEEILKADGRLRERGKEAWKIFDNGFYQTTYIQGSLKNEVKEDLIKFIKKNKKTNKTYFQSFNESDLYNIFVEVLRVIFIERFNSNKPMMQTCTQEEIQKIHLKISAEEQVNSQVKSFIFPMYDLQIDLDKFSFFGVDIYSSSQEGVQLLKQEHSEAEKYDFSDGSVAEVNSYAVMKFSGSRKKALSKALKKAQEISVWIKVVLEKNSIDGFTCLSGRIVDKYQENKFRIDGLTEIIDLDENKKIPIHWPYSSEVEDSKKNFDNKVFFYANNFFYKVVQNGVFTHALYITERNKHPILEDLAFLTDLFKKNGSKEILKELTRAGQFSSDAMTEANPIKEVLFMFTALETLATSSDKCQVTKRFKCNVAEILIQNMTLEEISKVLLQNFTGRENLEKFLEDIYDYRSNLIHGSTDIVKPKYNMLIRRLSTFSLFSTLKIISENESLNSIKSLQEFLEKQWDPNIRDEQI